MEGKWFKVKLQYRQVGGMYVVERIIGPDAVICVRALQSRHREFMVRAGTVLDESQVTRLGVYAELTTVVRGLDNGS
jgi:hypothetical protein